MQETRYDGKEIITIFPTEEQIDKASKNPKNKTVTLHNVGSHVHMVDGTVYEVQENGSWKKIKTKFEAAAESLTEMINER